jgi:hypothetical protein
LENSSPVTTGPQLKLVAAWAPLPVEGAATGAAGAGAGAGATGATAGTAATRAAGAGAAGEATVAAAGALAAGAASTGAAAAAAAGVLPASAAGVVCAGAGVAFPVFAAATADFDGAADSLALARDAAPSEDGAMLHPVKDSAPIVSVMAIFLNKRTLRAKD